MPGGRAAFRPRVPTALLAGSGHWHVAGIISAQPWPAGSFPGPAPRPVHSLPWGHLRWLRAGLGSGPTVGRVWGGQTLRDAHGRLPSVGAAGTGTAGDGNGLAQARLWLAARRPPGSPNRHRQARIRLGWVPAVGCRVSPIILSFTGSPALLAPTGASPACASIPRAGVRKLRVVQGGVGHTGCAGAARRRACGGIGAVSRVYSAIPGG